MDRGRLIKTVFCALLVLQAAVLAPVASAYAAGAHATDATRHCPEQVPQDHEDCACCPDGTTATDCASACAAVLATGFAAVTVAPSIGRESTPNPAFLHPSREDVPPDPPPIR